MMVKYVWSRLGVLGVCGVVLLFAAVQCSSKVDVKSMAVGAAAPNFTLKDVDGKDHSLESYKGKIVVLDFCSQECPYSRGSDEALIKIANEYKDKGVVFLGIDSNKKTTPAEIKEYAARTKIPYPILKDTGNALADEMGASRTPEIYILDKDLKLAYHGAFDDRKKAETRGGRNYVRNALDDLLAGRPVKTAEVEPWGCTIKRAK